MEWFANLSSRWQRVIIAVVLVLLLVGFELLRELVKTEEILPEREKGTAARELLEQIKE